MYFSIKESRFKETQQGLSRISVVGSDKVLSWKNLQERAYYFRDRLIENNVKKGQTIAIIGHKEADFLPIICACIMIGVSYIPIDSSYPKGRVLSILKSIDVFCVFTLPDEKILFSYESIDFKGTFIDPELIYILFTSGSTGTPKGVQIKKESILNLVEWMRNDFKFPEKVTFMNQAILSFDLSVYELMYTLNFGHTIILNSAKEIHSPNFLEKLKTNKINVWVSTPSFAMFQLLNKNFSSEHLTDLSYFLFCGEILTHKLVKILRKKFPDAKIINSYGPTEATVAVTMVEITDKIIEENRDRLPVGLERLGNKVFIKEDEIYIQGPSVMKGYLNNPKLNNHKIFYKKEERIFKTGDLGYKKNGYLYCKGRSDNQIKMLGYRIELGEIENVISEFEYIEENVCLPIKRNDEVIKLVSVLKFTKKIIKANKDKKIFYIEISNKLPSYMIPSEFYILEDFPKTKNFKIDRQLLNQKYINKDLKEWI